MEAVPGHVALPVVRGRYADLRGNAPDVPPAGRRYGFGLGRGHWITVGLHECDSHELSEDD
jgi:hypothetical protein